MHGFHWLHGNWRKHEITSGDSYRQKIGHKGENNSTPNPFPFSECIVYL